MTDSDPTLLAEWSRLGVLWNVPAARRVPDVESLIVRSLSPIRRNPRMLVLLSTWMSIFWRCVGRDRLAKLASAASTEEQSTLAIVLETVDIWLAAPVFNGISRYLPSLVPPRPLFEAERERPALAHLAEIEANPISRRRGLWCLSIDPKPNAIRPIPWALKTNPPLKVRALFKGSLKTSLLATIKASGKPPLCPTRLARECGVTRKAVYSALEDLQFAGLIPTTPERARSASRHA